MIERWRDSEPLRLYLYGLVGPLLAAAVVYGLLDARQVAAWAAVAAAVLVPTVERARQAVKPYRPEHRAE